MFKPFSYLNTFFKISSTKNNNIFHFLLSYISDLNKQYKSWRLKYMRVTVLDTVMTQNLAFIQI